MIREVDVDGDGRIDFYEFVNALGEPENTDDEEEDDEDGDNAANVDDSPSQTSKPVVKTVITSPVESPKALVFNAPPMAEDDNNVETEAGTSKSSSNKVNEPAIAVIPAEQPKSRPNRPTARQRQQQQPRSRPTSRPLSRSVSPDPAQKASISSNNTAAYERRRSPSLKDTATGHSNLDVKDGEGSCRRLSRSGLISEEIYQIGRASFRESYNAIVKPSQKSDPDSPTSETNLYMMGISDMEAFRALMHGKNRNRSDSRNETKFEVETEQKQEALSDHSEGDSRRDEYRRNSGHVSPSYARSSRVDRNMMDESFDIDDKNHSIEFEVEETVEADGTEIAPYQGDVAYRPIPGFESTAFYLTRLELPFSKSKT